MYLLYCDASGTPEIVNPQNSCYVLLGVAIHETAWDPLERSVRRLKGRYELPGNSFELHASDISLHIHEQDDISEFAELTRPERRAAVEEIRKQKLAGGDSKERKKKRRDEYRATDPFIHLTRLERCQLFEEILDLVASTEGLKLFGEVVEKKWLLRKTGEVSATRHAFEQVASRFDAFLASVNRRGPTDSKGLLVFDNDPNSETSIRSLSDQFREVGHTWGRMHHVIESPFFVDSRTASGVQLADICAYATRRYVERAVQGDTREKANFLRIFRKFDRSTYRLHGLRHWCERGSCSCLICAERGQNRVEGEDISEGGGEL